MNELSFSTIAATLAALGTAALTGCAAQQPEPKGPVQAHEVPAAAPTDAGATASCSAGSCGAKEDSAATSPKSEASCGAKEAEGSCGAKAAAASDKSGAGSTEDASRASERAPGPEQQAAAPANPAPRPAKKMAPIHAKKAGAKGGCGAGTCG